MTKQRLLLGAGVIALIAGVALFARWPNPADPRPAAARAEAENRPPPADRAERERQLAENLSGTTLIGFMGRNHKGRIEAVAADAGYRLGKVEKNPAGLWRFDYFMPGTDTLFDMPPVAVEWAGEIPVIVITEIAIPGKAGTFSARILIDGDQYSGTWSDGKSRGCMFGAIVRERESST